MIHHTDDKYCCGDNNQYNDMSSKCSCSCEMDTNDTEQHTHSDSNTRWLPVGVSFVLLLLGVWFDYQVMPFFDGYIKLIWFVIAYLVVATPVLINTFKEFLNRDFFNEFSLMSLATIGAFCIGEYPEAVGVMLFYTVGEIFQEMAVNRAKGSIKSLLDIRPDKALVKRNGVFVEDAPRNVRIGEVIRVRVGDKVPLDGVILNDKSSFNTSALTGESVPKTIRKGQRVLAGMINIDYMSEIEVDKAYEDSSLAKILYLTQNAISRKAKAELFIRKFARVYTPIVFALALLITFLPALFVDEYLVSEWLYRGLVFLVISCPCALVISVPLGYFSGIGLASKNGILFKGANYMETLTNLTHIAFDKTGTLTKGTFTVKHIESLTLSDDEFIALVAEIEKHSNHPIAKAIVDFARTKEITFKGSMEQLKEIAGQGLQAYINGKKVLVGNSELLKNNNIAFDKTIDDMVETKILVSIDEIFAGYIIIADELRQESSKLMTMLKKAGNIKTLMLSGDNDAIAQKVGKEVQIDLVYGNLLPEDKVKVIEKLKADKNNVVAYVGDGINDSPALALSDVGVAIGSLGSQAAIEVADMVIQTDNVTSIATAIKIAKSTQSIVVQNIMLALGIKAVIMLLGALGYASMWLAVFADVGVALLAILNSVRLIFKKI